MAVPILLIALTTVAVIQVGYFRNLMTDAAVDGARVAANADGTLAEGAEQAKRQLVLALGSADSVAATAKLKDSDGLAVASVTLTAPIPALGLILSPATIEVTADATLELQ